MKRKLKAEDVKHIIPMFEKGYTATKVAGYQRKDRTTIMRWVRLLRENGYEVKLKRGKRKISQSTYARRNYGNKRQKEKNS